MPTFEARYAAARKAGTMLIRGASMLRAPACSLKRYGAMFSYAARPAALR